MPDATQIGGQLPWQGGGGGMFSGGMSGLAQSYNNAYNSALNFNKSNYNNVLSGYQTALSNQVNAENQIGHGYTDLNNQVMGDLARLGTTQTNRNQRNYAQQWGQTAQQMIDRGLGNTTVQVAANRGLQADLTTANNSVAEQVGNMKANYGSQLGQAGLGFRERAMGMNTNLQKAQLDWMNSVNAPYPNAGAYAQIAQMYGQQAQADKNRQMMMSLGGGMGSQGGYGGGGGQQTYGTGWQPPAWTRDGGYSQGVQGLQGLSSQAASGAGNGFTYGSSIAGGGADQGQDSNFESYWANPVNAGVGETSGYEPSGYGYLGGNNSNLADYQADPMF